MCLYCPKCGVRDACKARQKYHVALDIMDAEWAEDLLSYCEENTTDDIVCIHCHAR